jgi:hypothetical protein
MHIVLSVDRLSLNSISPPIFAHSPTRRKCSRVLGFAAVLYSENPKITDSWYPLNISAHFSADYFIIPFPIVQQKETAFLKNVMRAKLIILRHFAPNNLYTCKDGSVCSHSPEKSFYFWILNLFKCILNADAK